MEPRAGGTRQQHRSLPACRGPLPPDAGSHGCLTGSGTPFSILTKGTTGRRHPELIDAYAKLYQTAPMSPAPTRPTWHADHRCCCVNTVLIERRACCEFPIPAPHPCRRTSPSAGQPSSEEPSQRRSPKKARRSSTSSFGSSMAAKWPPAECSLSIGHRMLRVHGSSHDRFGVEHNPATGYAGGPIQSRSECSASDRNGPP
jgi:hypothetical protein